MQPAKKSQDSVLNTGRVAARKKQVPKLLLLGVLGVILMYVGVAGTVSVTSPWWLGRGDAPRHVDYAWRVYNKQLPKFEDGLQQKDLNVLRKNLYRNQPAASNPPLFYVLHAPFIGPSLKSGQWQKAIAIGRALNIVLGIMCVIALAWGGWVFGGKRRQIFAVAVPAIAVMTHAFTTLNLNYAVDVLLVLLSTLTLINIYKITEKGLKPIYVFWLSLLCVAGMSTKVTYLPFVLLSFVCILITPILGNDKVNIKKDKILRFVKPVLICAGLALIITLAIGWFYYFRNYKVSGSFSSAIPPNGYPTNRPYKTAYDVITGSGLWRLLYLHYSSLSVLSVAFSSFVVANLLVSLDRFKRKDILKNKQRSVAILFLISAYVGMFLIQVRFAIGTGSYAFRYLIPALLPLGLLSAYALLVARKTRGQLIVFFAAALGYATIYGRASDPAASTISFPSIPDLYHSLKQLPEMVYANGISRSILVVLLVGFILGVILLSVSIFNLTGKQEY